jgi:hypothetical protein
VLHGACRAAARNTATHTYWQLHCLSQASLSCLPVCCEHGHLMTPMGWLCLCFPFLLLQPRTCANYNPITNPGEQFECPADTEFDPEAGNKTNPDVAACCRVRTLYKGAI